MSRTSSPAAATGGTRSALLSFVPYHELDGRSNVIVDGAPASGTVLCLTHWPGIACPPEFQADRPAWNPYRRRAGRLR